MPADRRKSNPSDARRAPPTRRPGESAQNSGAAAPRDLELLEANLSNAQMARVLGSRDVKGASGNSVARNVVLARGFFDWDADEDEEGGAIATEAPPEEGSIPGLGAFFEDAAAIGEEAIDAVVDVASGAIDSGEDLLVSGAETAADLVETGVDAAGDAGGGLLGGAGDLLSAGVGVVKSGVSAVVDAGTNLIDKGGDVLQRGVEFAGDAVGRVADLASQGAGVLGSAMDALVGGVSKVGTRTLDFAKAAWDGVSSGLAEAAGVARTIWDLMVAKGQEGAVRVVDKGTNLVREARALLESAIDRATQLGTAILGTAVDLLVGLDSIGPAITKVIEKLRVVIDSAIAKGIETAKQLALKAELEATKKWCALSHWWEDYPDLSAAVTAELDEGSFGCAAGLILGASDEQLAPITGDEALLDRIDAEVGAVLDTNPIFDRLFTACPGVAEMKLVFHDRYGVHVGSNGDPGAEAWIAARGGEVAFEEGGIKRMYGAFALFPEDHLSVITHLMANATSTGKTASGAASKQYFRVSYDAGKLEELESGQYTNPGDISEGLNVFDTLVLHEVAHLIDHSDDYSDKEDYLKISGWKHYPASNKTPVVDDLIGDLTTPYPANLTDKEKAAAKNAGELAVTARMKDAAKTDDHVKAAYGALAMKEAGDGADYRSAADLGTALQSTNLFTQIVAGHADNGAWWNEPFASLGSRQYHESYSWDGWWSYDNDARDPKFSIYQFRAPGEEFAELYATYHLTTPKGSTVPDKFKTWFESEGLHE